MFFCCFHLNSRTPIAKIGNFKKNNIPILPFLDGLTDSNEETRLAAIKVLEKYFEEEPDIIEIDDIINTIDPNNYEILNSVVSLLGKIWKYNPEKVVATLLIFIKFDNEQLKENISDILVDKYSSYTDLVVQNLIKIPDVSKFITKGIISKTLIRIGKTNPSTVIQLMIKYFSDENKDVRLNALNSIDGLIEDFLEYIDVKPVLILLDKDENKQIKKIASSIISNIAQKDPSLIKPHMSEFLQILVNQELTVRIVLSKSLLEIAKESPDIIPVQDILNFLDDQDSFIRETSVKILGFIGYKLPFSVVPSLLWYISRSLRMQSSRQSTAVEPRLYLYIGVGQ